MSRSLLKEEQARSAGAGPMPPKASWRALASLGGGTLYWTLVKPSFNGETGPLTALIPLAIHSDTSRRCHASCRTDLGAAHVLMVRQLHPVVGSACCCTSNAAMPVALSTLDTSARASAAAGSRTAGAESREMRTQRTASLVVDPRFCRCRHYHTILEFNEVIRSASVNHGLRDLAC